MNIQLPLRFIIGCAFAILLSPSAFGAVPTVDYTDAADAATGVALNRTITATFSEAMDPATISTATFTVSQGVNPVAGAVTYSGTTATFTPNAVLAASLPFTATITTGATSLVGAVPLASPYIWNFTTGATLAAGPAPVVLGSAGNYVVLAKTAISTTGTTGIVGNIGLSPAAESFLTGFSQARDPSNQWSTTGFVTGKLYASDMAPPTPSQLTSAIGDMQTAFTDAAGRVTPDYTELYSGDLSGRTMVPGLYKWGTGVMITSGVTFAGGANDVWILQVAQDLTVGNGAIISLSGGAQSKNIFWQVAGQATLGTTSEFKGIILSQTLIAVNTGATINGRVLAQTAVTMDANTIVVGLPADTTPPMVSSTFPANAATGVGINQNINATFSEAMDNLSITSATMTLKQGATQIAGAVTYAGVTATFNPTSDLTASTVYTVTITTGAKDLAGNALANNYVWTLTTGATADLILPTVNSTSPANTATGVAINQNLNGTFSEAMDPLTITTATMTLKQGTTSIAGVVSYAGVTATFNPASNLSANTPYTVTITTGAKDLAGNALANNYVWTLTTAATTDVVLPTVSSTSPATSAIGVTLNQGINVTFGEAMDPLTITTATMTLKQGATSIAGVVTYAGVTATFNPASNLTANTVYTVTVTTGAKDLAGNALASDQMWSFTTGTTSDATPPSVVSTVPTSTAIGVALDQNIVAVFSEAMSPLTITTATMTLKQGATPVVGNVTFSGMSGTFVPANILAENTTYTATITTGVKDLAGNALAANYTWSFTTKATVPANVDDGDDNNRCGLGGIVGFMSIFAGLMLLRTRMRNER